MALSHDPWMSVEEYLQLDRSSIETRYEYIDGYVSMLAGGTLDHATIGQISSVSCVVPCVAVNAVSSLRMLVYVFLEIDSFIRMPQ